MQVLLREEKSVIERRIRADHLRRSRVTEEKFQQKNHKCIVEATVGALKTSKNATDKEVRLQLDWDEREESRDRGKAEISRE